MRIDSFAANASYKISTMPEDDTSSSSAASAPISLSSDMLEDDVDAVSSLSEFLMEPPLMVGPPQQLMHDETPELPEKHEAAATAAVPPPCRRYSRKSIIILFVIIVTILLITYTQTTYLNETHEQIKFQIRFSVFAVRNIYHVLSVNRRKREGLENVVAARNSSSSIENSTIRPSSWPEPPLDLFQNSTRLIWAYWHSGEDNLSALCQISLQSWKANHPNWQIIILSDETYRNYVPSHHIPSTFDQLKVQFRSDIVRLSVLARYGGAYLDMTTLMFKSLEGIWESELKRVESRGGYNRVFAPTVLEFEERRIEDEDESLLTTAMSTLADQSSSSKSKNAAVGLVTNSVILSPQPNNPLILEFLNRILQYSENPASTAQELKIRPEFTRVQPYMTNYQRKLGILGKDGLLLYSAHLWLFTDLVLFDKEMEAGKYFVDLPALRWTFDFMILPRTLAKFDALGLDEGASACDSATVAVESESSSSSCVSSQATSTPSSSKSIQEQLQDERIHSWSVWHVLRHVLFRIIPWHEFDDVNLANYFLQDAVLFKVSTDAGSIQHQKSLEDLMSMENTLGRLYRIAMVGTGMNATLEGARPFGYGAEEACSFEFDEC